MADNEQMTANPDNAPRTNVPPVNTRGHEGTSFRVEEGSNQDDYMHELEDELIHLREYKRKAEAESSRQPFQQQMPLVGTVSPSQSSKPCSFKTFMSSKPPEFAGSTNPSVTMNWLRNMERKFDVTHCEEESKVPYAVQCLTDKAMVWWDSITGHLTQQQKEAIRWPDLHQAVCNQYCSDFDMARIRREFVNLHLTEKMTIDELITQFSERLRFVQDWVPNERTRIEQFVEALPHNYRTSVRLAGTLSQAFNLARSVDSDIRGQGLQIKDTASQKSGFEPSGKGKQRWQGSKQGQKSGTKSVSVGSPTWCNNCKSKHVGPCTPQTTKCIKCGGTRM